MNIHIQVVPNITHRQQTPLGNTQQANYTGPTIFPATNPTLFPNNNC